MKKLEYLGKVDAFTTWMARHLKNDSTLHHHYHYRKGKTAIQFSNLADAMQKYAWPIAPSVREEGISADSLAANTLVLDKLQNALKAARTDSSMRDACIRVMQWGGVTNGNVSWLKANTIGLTEQIDNVALLLKSGDDGINNFPDTIRFNAGMTKVYSLLVDGFIIYDSRVAAALCWFIMQWMLENNVTQTPDELKFPCMSAKESSNSSNPKSRNPSNGSHQFPQLNNHSRLHAHWNLRASWLLEAALKKAEATTEFHKMEKPLRALEAALFMWGYDLKQNLPTPTMQTS
jgi:hypothetical protein